MLCRHRKPEMESALSDAAVFQPDWAIHGRADLAGDGAARTAIHRGSIEFLRRRSSLWPQLGLYGICAVFAFRDLLLSGNRFCDRARAEAGRGWGAGFAQTAPGLYAATDLFGALHRPCRPAACGGGVSRG